MKKCINQFLLKTRLLDIPKAGHSSKIINAVIGIIVVCGVNRIYLNTLIDMQTRAMKNSPRILSKKDAERVVEKEKRKLGVDKIIRLEYYDENVADSRKTEIGTYVIRMGGAYRNESVIRHELYHIYDGHCDHARALENSLLQNLFYLYYYEPKATMYQAWNWK